MPAATESIPADAQARTSKPAGTRERPQRARLIEAVIELAAREGSHSLSVAQISTQARVSSATFYEQFTDKEDCLIAAYRAAAERLLVTDLPKPLDGDWAQAASATLRQLGLALAENPAAARLLFLEPLAPGGRLREARAGALGAFASRVQEFLDSAPAGAHTLDVPAVVLVGAMRSIIARYLRTHGESELPGLADDGVAWVLSYAVSPSRARWSTSPRALLAAPAAAGVSKRAPSRSRLPRGRHGLPPGIVARSQRTRIIYGTAEVTARKGYLEATVADIVAAAGVSRDVFYAHFSDKQHAFLEAQNHPTQHILDSCAHAYFSVEEWPRRMCRMLAALLAMIAENPAISHLRLIECYAAGPEAIRRAEEITRSFTIFLEEGFRHGPSGRQLPSLSAQAIAGGVLQTLQRQAARGELAELPRLLPRLTYVCVAPFIGAEEAIEFVDAEMRSMKRGAR